MRFLVLFACFAAWLNAEIIDRLVITVDRHAITEQQLDEELRVTAFLNGEPVVRSRQTLHDAADRMIEQLLILREMEMSHYPMPNRGEVSQYLEQLQSRFAGSADFEKRLETYALSDDILRDHLAQQIVTLRFVDYRFRSGLSISDAEIEARYHAESGTQGTTVPEAAKESIRQELIGQRTDEALDRWLQEARRHVKIVYLEPSLQ